MKLNYSLQKIEQSVMLKKRNYQTLRSYLVRMKGKYFIASSKKEKPLEKGTPSMDLSHYSLDKVMMSAFIDGCIENDLEVLRKNDEQTIDDLQRVKLHIISAFYEAKGDEQTTYYISLVARLEEKRLHIIRIKALVEAIKERPLEYLAKLLRAEGYNYSFSPETIESDIKSVTNQEAMNLHEYNMILSEYKDYEAQQNDRKKKAGKSTGKESIYQTLNAIEEMQHTVYDIDKLNVYRYAMLCKKLDAFIVAQIDKNGG